MLSAALPLLEAAGRELEPAFVSSSPDDMRNASYATIESQGAVTLAVDPTSKSTYAGTAPIRLAGGHVATPYDNRFDVVAADDFGTSGGKQVVLRRIGGGLTVWQMDAGWNRTGNLPGANPRANEWYALETKFGVDFDADGVVGPLTAVESRGAVTLNRDASSRVYAVNKPIRLTGVHVVTPYDNRFDVVAADDFGTAGGKQVVLRRIGGGLVVWQMDAGWGRTANLPGADRRDSNEWNALEAKFGIDFDQDGDVGFNHLKSIPVLTQATSSAENQNTTIAGTISGPPNAALTVLMQFFANSSDFGQGRRLIGTSPATVQFDARGEAMFQSFFSGVVPVGQSITATVTVLNNTSQVSRPITVGERRFDVIAPPDFGGGFSLAALDPQRQAIVTGYIERLNERIASRWTGDHIAPVPEEGYYPSMLALNDLSIYLVTGDPRNLERARQQLDYSLTFENRDGLMVVGSAPSRLEGWIGRDSIARHLYSLYMGYRVTGDVKYLEHATRNAEQSMQLLARGGNAATHGYGLFYSRYSAEDYRPLTSPFINPNQDAALALGLFFLYDEPESSLYRDSRVLQVVRDLVGAALSIQVEETGEIPVAGTSTDPHGFRAYDTNYGGYALWSVAIMNRSLRDPTYAKHLELGARWLDAVCQAPHPEDHRSSDSPDRTKPDYTIQPLGLKGSWERLVVFAEAGRQPRGFGDYPFRLMAELSTSPDRVIGREFSLVFLHVLGYGWTSFLTR